jgi:hypothetical protein
VTLSGNRLRLSASNVPASIALDSLKLKVGIIDATELRDKAIAALGGVAFVIVRAASARASAQASNDRHLGASSTRWARQCGFRGATVRECQRSSTVAPQAPAGGPAQPERSNNQVGC